MSKNLATSALPLQTEVLPPGKSQVGRGAVSGGAPGERWEPVSGRNLPAKCEYFRTPEPLRHVHGLGLSMVGTPRAVTASSREQQVSIEISDLGDFAKRTTSFSTGADVGSPTQAPILAQIAEPCINEMRKGEASKGQWLTIIFNAVQTASFAQASGAALAGNGQVTGGSDNYHAKPPVVNKFQSDFQCTAGMFDRFQWAGDLGVPTGKNVLADRIGYPSEASGNVEGNVSSNIRVSTSAQLGRLTPTSQLNPTVVVATLTTERILGKVGFCNRLWVIKPATLNGQASERRRE